MDNNTTVYELKQLYKKFCDDRDWNQFHNPKDLAIGIVSEASELLQIFRFKNDNEINEVFLNKKDKIVDELADIMLFTLRFAERNDIDLSEAIKNKLAKNAKKYPIELAKGSNKKYDEF